jgi:hypothetical protein
VDRGERQRYYRTDASGRDRDGRQDLVAKSFCGFCCGIYEEKKRIENRIEERKKSGWVDREGERKKRSMRAISPPLDMMNPPALTPVTLPLDPGHRCFFALARTRASNTTLTIMLCAV